MIFGILFIVAIVFMAFSSMIDDTGCLIIIWLLIFGIISAFIK